MKEGCCSIQCGQRMLLQHQLSVLLLEVRGQAFGLSILTAKVGCATALLRIVWQLQQQQQLYTVEHPANGRFRFLQCPTLTFLSTRLARYRRLDDVKVVGECSFHFSANSCPMLRRSTRAFSVHPISPYVDSMRRKWRVGRARQKPT